MSCVLDRVFFVARVCLISGRFNGVLFVVLFGFVANESLWACGINWQTQAFLWTSSLGELSNCAILATGAVLLHRALGCGNFDFVAFGAVATAVGALQLLLGALCMLRFGRALVQGVEAIVN